MNGRNFFVLSMMTENSGHLILDDLFWVENLIKTGDRVTILTSKESTLNIRAKISSRESYDYKFFKDWNWLKEINYRLFLLHRVIQIGRIRNSVFIIQGFEELSILLLFFRIRRFRNKIILVHTNNISPDRMKRGGILLKYILRKIFKNCDFICYHSDYVFQRMQNIIGGLDNCGKLIRVKYHLLNKPVSATVSIKRDNVISYFGPVMPSKPITDFCNLMKADNYANGNFNYRIVNVSDSIRDQIVGIFGSDSKIFFINEFREQEEYIKLIRTSSYVFLPHNSQYEGKLSGIFSDCVSNCIPIISDRIEPVLEFFRIYGQMGFLMQYSENTNWKQFLLDNHNSQLYNHFKVSLELCRNDHSSIRIMSEFMNSIEES